MNKGGGASGNPRLSAMFVSDPDRAIKLARDAIVINNGNVTRAAAYLGISDCTLFRRIKQFPKILEGVDR